MKNETVYISEGKSVERITNRLQIDRQISNIRHKYIYISSKKEKINRSFRKMYQRITSHIYAKGHGDSCPIKSIDGLLTFHDKIIVKKKEKRKKEKREEHLSRGIQKWLRSVSVDDRACRVCRGNSTFADFRRGLQADSSNVVL